MLATAQMPQLDFSLHPSAPFQHPHSQHATFLGSNSNSNKENHDLFGIGGCRADQGYPPNSPPPAYSPIDCVAARAEERADDSALSPEHAQPASPSEYVLQGTETAYDNAHDHGRADGTTPPGSTAADHLLHHRRFSSGTPGSNKPPPPPGMARVNPNTPSNSMFVEMNVVQLVDGILLDPHQCLSALNDMTAVFQQAPTGTMAHMAAAAAGPADMRGCHHVTSHHHSHHHHYHHHHHTPHHQLQHPAHHHTPQHQQHHLPVPQPPPHIHPTPQLYEFAPVVPTHLQPEQAGPGGDTTPSPTMAAVVPRKDGRPVRSTAGNKARPQQQRKAPASRKSDAHGRGHSHGRRSSPPVSRAAAGKIKGGGRAAAARPVPVASLPKDVAHYRDDEGEWTTFLTDLPTVELNAFLKLSSFTKADIASLKKMRRKRKCNVYTRRFRDKKAAQQQHAGISRRARGKSRKKQQKRAAA